VAAPGNAASLEIQICKRPAEPARNSAVDLLVAPRVSAALFKILTDRLTAVLRPVADKVSAASFATKTYKQCAAQKRVEVEASAALSATLICRLLVGLKHDSAKS
jgi:hypothetical protein